MRNKKTVIIFTLIMVLSLTIVLIPIKPAMAAHVLIKGGTQKMKIALTFDAGSNEGYTRDILKILSQNNVKAAFFLTGKWIEAYPQTAKMIVTQGHGLGNHSYSHPDFAQLTVGKMKEEINKTDELAKLHLGRKLKPFFRPPFGSYSKAVLNMLEELGYCYSVMWTVDTLDWKGISYQEINQRVMRGQSSGGIVLMHVGSGTQTPQALPSLIEKLRGEGYEFVTLEQLVFDNENSIYTVKAGETLWAISRNHGVGIPTLVDANRLTSADVIYKGQKLVIPGANSNKPGVYAVRKGDTLWGVSKRFQVPLNKLTEFNCIYDHTIYEGEHLIIPKIYEVQQGDTLWNISNKLGVSLTALKRVNNIDDIDFIYTHQKLTIPCA